MNPSLQTYQIPARGTCRARCVILHGLGDSHQGMAGLAQELRMPDITFVLPDAPDPYAGIGYSWYTIPPAFFTLGPQMDRKRLIEDCRPELERSTAMVHTLLDGLYADAPDLPILLGGFSQGGLVALSAGFTWPRTVSAMFSLSSYFPDAASALVKTTLSDTTPIFVGHGDADAVVAHAYSLETRDALAARGYTVDAHSYPGMGHSICTEELTHLRAFIERSLA